MLTAHRVSVSIMWYFEIASCFHKLQILPISRDTTIVDTGRTGRANTWLSKAGKTANLPTPAPTTGPLEASTAIADYRLRGESIGYIAHGDHRSHWPPHLPTVVILCHLAQSFRGFGSFFHARYFASPSGCCVGAALNPLSDG